MAMAATAEVAAWRLIPAQVIASAFVKNYYQILQHSPETAYRFYRDTSMVGRPEKDGSITIYTTLQTISESDITLNYGDNFEVEIKSVDAQDCLITGGIHVLVTGSLSPSPRNFAQSFYLAPQHGGGYFVSNDTFQYIDSDPEPNSAPVEEEYHDAPPAEEAVASPENGDVVIVEDVVEEVEEDDDEMVVVPNAKVEELPKKSYLSIVTSYLYGLYKQKPSAAALP